MARGNGSGVKHTSNINNEAFEMPLGPVNLQLDGKSCSEMSSPTMEDNAASVASNLVSGVHGTECPLWPQHKYHLKYCIWFFQCSSQARDSLQT